MNRHTIQLNRAQPPLAHTVFTVQPKEILMNRHTTPTKGSSQSQGYLITETYCDSALFRMCLALILWALSSALGMHLYAGGCCDLSTPFSCSTPVHCGGGCAQSCTDDCATCRTIILGRSTHNNSPFFGLTPYLYLPDETRCYGGLLIGYEFLQSFDTCGLAQALAGSKTILFQGSQVPNRSSQAIIADYFGLSQTYTGSVTLHPTVKNHNVHMQMYYAFDAIAPGLYTTIDMTFTSQTRHLVSNSCTLSYNAFTASTLTPFPAAYMGEQQVPSAPTLLEALSGRFTFGDMSSTWNAQRWTPYGMTDNKLAGLSVNVGYSPWLCEEYHLGMFLRYTAPTGTPLDGTQKFYQYLFAPIIGNGHHHELGAGLHAHATLWDSQPGHTLSGFIDGYATHLFANTQWRTFDFKNRGCLSRYMLLKELVPATASDVFDPNSVRIYDYIGANGLINGVNFTTRHSRSSFGVQGEGSIRLIYTYEPSCERSVSITGGYNIFGRSTEKLCLIPYSPCSGIDGTKTYGFKGCQGVYAYQYTLDGNNQTIGTGSAIPLNSTSSNSTMNTTCGTTDNGVNLFITDSTAGIAWNTVYTGSNAQANALPTGTPVPGSVILAQESQPAQPVSVQDLDIRSGTIPHMITHRGFLTIEYQFDTCGRAPFIGVGFEGEGGSCGNDIHQFGFWIRGGCAW